MCSGTQTYVHMYTCTHRFKHLLIISFSRLVVNRSFLYYCIVSLMYMYSYSNMQL